TGAADPSQYPAGEERGGHGLLFRILAPAPTRCGGAILRRAEEHGRCGSTEAARVPPPAACGLPAGPWVDPGAAIDRKGRAAHRRRILTSVLWANPQCARRFFPL